MTTPTETHDRIVAICATITGVNTAQKWHRDTGVPFASSELAAAIVSPAPNVIHRRISDTIYERIQEWIMLYLIARFPDDTELRDRTTWDLALPYIERVPETFHASRNLEYNDGGIVKSITLPTLVSIGPETLDGAMYVSAGFRMNTTTIHRL